MKFKVGDIVKLIKQTYYLDGDRQIVVGDTLEIAGFDTRDGEKFYMFKNDTDEEPLWLNVERYFKLVDTTWKARLGGV